MKITFGTGEQGSLFTGKKEDNDAIIFLVDDVAAGNLENETQKHILASAPAFGGKIGQVIEFPAPLVFSGEGKNYKKGFFLGVGALKNLDALAAEAVGGRIAGLLKGQNFNRVSIVATDLVKNPVNPERLADMANAARLKSYAFDKYKTGEKPLETELVFSSYAKAAYESRAAVSDGIILARDLANEPPNVLNPLTMGERIEKALLPLGIKVRIVEKQEMERLGMGAALAVGGGSQTPPRIVVMEYDGTNGTGKGGPLALVGKGLTFDSGGISLKKDGGVGMKFDMCGAAAVVGAMQALAARGARAHVVGVVGLAENAIGSRAYRNDDILTTMSGKTVEINNTDAEGRLVLCDCLTFVQREYKPKTVIDLATLTGACVAALSHTYAGVMSNNDALWRKVEKAGRAVNELPWRLPLHASFGAAMRGVNADLRNSGGAPGASTAAAFLQEFIEPGVKWAHLDIAGMANGVSGHPTMPDGIGTGFGVRLLDRLVADYFEQAPTPACACKKEGPCCPQP